MMGGGKCLGLVGDGGDGGGWIWVVISLKYDVTMCFFAPTYLENVVSVASWGMVRGMGLLLLGAGKSGIRQLDELVKVGEVVEGCWGWIWQHFFLGGKPLSIVPLKQEIRYGIFRLESWGVGWGGWGFVQVEGWCGVIFFWMLCFDGAAVLFSHTQGCSRGDT